jgi:hypothetical protein
LKFQAINDLSLWIRVSFANSLQCLIVWWKSPMSVSSSAESSEPVTAWGKASSISWIILRSWQIFKATPRLSPCRVKVSTLFSS